mmetsp:Transcript_10225/g.16891  ORF Transcript_10225/g.16891 Transcript_10225/m.16891 type:complete len:293 (-) Transcript_10225:9-887(-)
MLTRKQLWRRTRERTSTTPKYPKLKTETSYQSQDIDDVQQIPTKEASRKAMAKADLPPSAPVRLKSALSSSNLLGMLGRKVRDERQLRFSSTVHVLLIPSRVELMCSFENIYWLHKDFTQFKKDAVKEIREAASVYSISAKAAMTLLYQPDPNTDDTSDEAQGMVLEDEPQAYDYYTPGAYTDSSDNCQNVSIDYTYHCSNHPAPMARKDSNYLLDQASPHSVTMASPKTSRDLKFITNVKTDVELNAPTATLSSSVEKSDGFRARIPTRTTTNAPQKQHAWAVQWKKQQQT